MTFKCKIGFHSWQGCKCYRCGKTRDKYHQLDKYIRKCKVCSITLTFDNVIMSLHDRDKYQRHYAAHQLGFLKDKRAFKPLMRALNDADEGLKREAVEALGNLGDIRAYEPLCKILNHEDSHMRSIAVQALGELRDFRAIDPLTKTLEDRSSSVRIDAKYALKKLGSKRTLDSEAKMILFESNKLRLEKSIPILNNYTKIPIPKLIERLDGLGGRMASDTVGISQILGEKRATEAISVLVKTLRNWDPRGNEITSPPWFAIVWALGQIGEYCGIESDFLAGSGPIVPIALFKLGAYDLLLKYLDTASYDVFKFENSYYFNLREEKYNAIVLLASRISKSKPNKANDLINEKMTYASFLGSTNYHVRWAASEALSKIDTPYWKESLTCNEDSNNSDWKVLINSEHPLAKDALQAVVKYADSYEIRDIANKRLETLSLKLNKA
jgi:hypothetical protein